MSTKIRNRIRRKIGWQLIQGDHQAVGLALHEAYVLEATLYEFPKDRTFVAVRNGKHIALKQ